MNRVLISLDVFLHLPMADVSAADFAAGACWRIAILQILGEGSIRFIQFLKRINPLESLTCLNFHRLLFLDLFGERRLSDLIEIFNVLHHLHGGL